MLKITPISPGKDNFFVQPHQVHLGILPVEDEGLGTNIRKTHQEG